MACSLWHVMQLSISKEYLRRADRRPAVETEGTAAARRRRRSHEAGGRGSCGRENGRATGVLLFGRPTQYLRAKAPTAEEIGAWCMVGQGG